jgi:heptosyltransferase-1/heptosyltransferase-2
MTLERRFFRNRAYYVLARATELIEHPTRWTVQLLSGRTPVPPAQWKRAILMGADHIGDVLWLTPSLQALKRRLPNCEWWILAAPPGSDVLANNPWIQGVLAPLRTDRWIERFVGTAKILQHANFDAAICYNPLRYWPELFLSLLARIPNRAAYVHKGVSALTTHPIHINAHQPRPAYFRDLVGQLTGHAPDWPLKPEVHPSEQDRQAAEVFLAEHGIGNQRPVMACFVTSRQPNPVWPMSRFAEAIDQAAQSVPVDIVLCGSSSDEPVLLGLHRLLRAPSIINAGRFSLLALAAFLEQCAVAFTVDSGPRHLANASGIPVVFIRNLWANKEEMGAYLSSETDIAPEGEHLTESAHIQALATLSPQTAAAALIHVLRRHPREA